MLLLNGTLTGCPGLVHGKAGIAVFFFHYGRHTGNELFDRYAMELIDAMREQIHINSAADYERGIAGIGTGMDYLIRNGFLETDGDFFDDFDTRMYRAVMYDPWQDFSLYDGLAGYGRYWITRAGDPSSSARARECLLHIVGLIEERASDIPAGEQADVYCFLYDLRRIVGFDICAGLLERYGKWNLQMAGIDGCFPRPGNSAVGNIARMYRRSRYFDDALQDEIDAALKQLPEPDMGKLPAGMGLLTGLAGEAMLRLTAIRSIDASWMKLL
jgi:hypothetical protein